MRGKPKTKLCAATRMVACEKSASMRYNDRLAYGQTDAHARLFGRKKAVSCTHGRSSGGA